LGLRHAQKSRAKSAALRYGDATPGAARRSAALIIALPMRDRPTGRQPSGDGTDNRGNPEPAAIRPFPLSRVPLLGLRVGRSGSSRYGPSLVAGVRYSGRYRTGWILDGVLVSVG
jgi:hypothetical protein